MTPWPSALAGLTDDRSARASAEGRVLSAIVVNFRSSDLVNACLRALLDGTRPPDEIVVVDNEGLDGGLAADLASRRDVRVVVVPGNPGYAAACNRGVATSAGDALLFLNADVTVEPGCVERCLAELETGPDIGVVTCRLVRPDGRLDHAAHRGLPTAAASLAYKLHLHRLAPRSRRLARYTMAWLDPAEDHDVEACSGAFMLMRRQTLLEAGGWDERYRFYAEDLDLCMRIGRTGGRIRYLGTVSAVHLKGAFSHRHAEDRTLDREQRAVKRWVAREVAASHRLFYDEHIGPSSPPAVNAVVRLMFALQRVRIGAAEWLARA